MASYVMKQQFMTLIPWLIAVYAAICAVVYVGNRLFMYFPNPTRAAPAAAGLDHVKEIEIAAADGVALVAWYAPARNDKPTILYFHGNAANAANRAPRIELIREHGFGVLYLNNRGYGGSGGRPTEEDNVADAIAAYDHLIGLGVPPTRIAAYGETRWKWGGESSAPRMSRSGSKCSHTAPMTICLATAPGRRRGLLWIRWEADKKRKPPPDLPRNIGIVGALIGSWLLPELGTQHSVASAVADF